MKGRGYGKSYRYAHDESDAYAAGENYFPDGMQQTRYYWPAPRGLEIRIKEKLDQLRRLDAAKPAPDSTGESVGSEDTKPVSAADSKSDKP
jgi:putative ATPase